MKPHLIKLVITLLLATYGAWHEVVSLRLSEPGYYQGSVIEKEVSIGKNSSTHYLLVDWDGIGNQAIVVNPITYKQTKIGDRYTAQASYTPFLGAYGMAYIPDSGELGMFFFATAVLAKLAAILILILMIAGLPNRGGKTL